MLPSEWYSKRTSPVAISISCTIEVITTPRRGPPSGRRSCSTRSKAMISAVPFGRDRELVQVHAVAVGGAHGLHAAVALVVDHPDTAAVADDQAALPPREHGLAAVLLDPEVGRDLVARRLA